MNRVIETRRHRKKGSLDDSASDSGKILSYQRMPHDSPVKVVPQDGTAELATQTASGPACLKQRARAVPDSCYRSAGTTCRSEVPLSSETSRSRLSSANLEQNYLAYRNHPQSLDSHERTRQWLKSSELAMPASSYGYKSSRNQPKALQQQYQTQTQPINKKGPGWLSMFSCFKSQPDPLVCHPDQPSAKLL